MASANTSSLAHHVCAPTAMSFFSHSGPKTSWIIKSNSSGPICPLWSVSYTSKLRETALALQLQPVMRVRLIRNIQR